LWSIADDMSTKKEDGTFVPYMESYRWAARNMRQNGNRFTAKSLQNAYHEAKSSGHVD